ncbi:hypothetical protein XocVXO32_00935 [Xanthomonas oryzae pv. oryzicola]|uniref:hypothetical protein n=1 Tax=Xanthomonas oryzae TaxID=347 RepID=UPI000B059CFF|nr:hypothetical protein [Xanthomonas oryzae]
MFAAARSPRYRLYTCIHALHGVSRRTCKIGTVVQAISDALDRCVALDVVADGQIDIQGQIAIQLPPKIRG